MTVVYAWLAWLACVDSVLDLMSCMVCFVLHARLTCRHDMPHHSLVASLAGNAFSGYAVGPLVLGALGILGRAWLEADRTSELHDSLDDIKDVVDIKDFA